MAKRVILHKCDICNIEYELDGFYLCSDCRKIYEHYRVRYSSYEFEDLLRENGYSTDLHVSRGTIYFPHDYDKDLAKVITEILGVTKVEYCLCEVEEGDPHYADVCYYNEIAREHSDPKKALQHKNRVKYLKGCGLEIDPKESWAYINAKFEQQKRKHLAQLYTEIERIEAL